MERIIKFRGKCVEDSKYASEWVEGGYVAPDDSCPNQKEGLIVKKLGWNSTSVYHVIPSTVGQFTGLLDKNGKEIYEGDIFRFNELHTRYVVEYEEGVFHGKQIGSSSYVGLSYWLPDIVILGNKYDNPELMKR